MTLPLLKETVAQLPKRHSGRVPPRRDEIRNQENINKIKRPLDPGSFGRDDELRHSLKAGGVEDPQFLTGQPILKWADRKHRFHLTSLMENDK